MDTFQLRLERYFFTESMVRANPEHDPAGERVGSKLVPTFFCKPIADRPSAYTLEMTVRLDEATSVNPPYFFSLAAFAVVVAPPHVNPALAYEAVSGTGFNVLVGAIREHLAAITGRGPWGGFVFGPMTPPPPAQALNEP